MALRLKLYSVMKTEACVSYERTIVCMSYERHTKFLAYFRDLFFPAFVFQIVAIVHGKEAFCIAIDI